MSTPTNPLSGIVSSLAGVLAPNINNISAQAQEASAQLTLAFQTIIVEGAIIIGLQLIMLAVLWKHQRG